MKPLFNVVDRLEERGLLKDMTNPAFRELVGERCITVYVGFDPTADSLHVGNMVSILVLRHFQLAGHRPIALVGGGTGMIGDPSGRGEERNLLTAEQLERNLAGIRADLAKILSFEGENAALLLNNADWLASFGFLDFLREVGKHFRVGDMLAKESVRRRMESDTGLSFTEFSYQLLQGYDFKYLNEKYECLAQSGGSDQWGNITAGTELIRRTTGAECYGMTTPLLTNAQGQKMGKSLGGVTWLSGEKLSPYEFYQYWIRQEDADMERFLKMLTFLPVGDIARVLEDHGKDPGLRVAQKSLAWELTALVHGEEEARKAREASEALFGGALSNKTDGELRALFNDVPSVELPRAELEAGLKVADVLVRSGLVASKKEAARLLSQGGVYLNNSDTPLAAEVRQFTDSDLASETMMILRAGKKKYCLVQYV
ncbi:MAG: tyrosine--tRNA ligase [Candidatus Sumerlaeia bacterium]|nr:tyrosine--tRNA ligase [Candidatus Sumerlaeia bacterium]